MLVLKDQTVHSLQTSTRANTLAWGEEHAQGERMPRLGQNTHRAPACLMASDSLALVPFYARRAWHARRSAGWVLVARWKGGRRTDKAAPFGARWSRIMLSEPCDAVDFTH